MKTNDKIVSAIVKAMSVTADTVRPDYYAGISSYSENGLPGAIWDRREGIVYNLLKKESDIITHGFKRGSWKVIVALDKKVNRLYVMMSEANLADRQKKVKCDGTSTHYVYSLLRFNKEIKCEGQMELLPNDDEEYRKKDCERILGEYIEDVSDVVIVAFDYQQQVVTTAIMYLFDDHFNLAQEEDISDLLVTDAATSEEDAVGDSKNKESHEDDDDDNGQMVTLK